MGHIFHFQGMYEELTEEVILEYAHNGDAGAQDFIINKYKNFVKAKAKAYFIIGADQDDIVQEGMIGLFKAIRDYNPDKMVTFRTFADLCVQRQMISAIKAASRQKHLPLNSYISLNKHVFDDDLDTKLIDVFIAKHTLDPEELYIIREEMNKVENVINKVLSPFELSTLRLYLEGKTYQEISGHLNKSEKSIDNALQRVKKKLEKALANGEKLSTA